MHLYCKLNYTDKVHLSHVKQIYSIVVYEQHGIIDLNYSAMNNTMVRI